MSTPSSSTTDPLGSLTDPFGTRALRAAVLAAWRDSPTRLAEDVAAEAELRQIGYRDRVVTELAANAADAATAAGKPGRVRITAVGDTFRVANAGAPLTVDGVRALTALRVSPKNGEGVGRFGVGFRATALATRVDVLSSSGSITFDAARTRAEVAAGGVEGSGIADVDVPAQRLAWPLTDQPAAGYDTEVVLHLPAAEAEDLLAGARREAPDLLLELPALVEIAVGDEVYRRAESGDHLELLRDGRPLATWLQARAGGNRWLVPIVDGVVRPLGADVLRSPTPTEVPLTLPARLITALALTPDRRSLHPDARVADAVAGYPELIALVPAEQRYLLVPEPGFAAGREDAELREAIAEALTGARWVPSASGELLAPERAWVLRGLTPDLAELLGEPVAPLVAPELSDGPPARALIRLGARELSLAELVDLLAGSHHEPAWWARLYAALDPLATGRDQLAELGALPVPRADGRSHRGVRGLALVEQDGDAPCVRIDWVPVIDPQAYHPLLDRLGLERLTTAQVLDHPALRQEIELADDHEELADAVLQLLDGLDERTPVPSWLGALRLPTDDGDERAADELLLPGGPLRSVLAHDAPFGAPAPAVIDAYGAGALRKLGVGWGFTVLTDELPVAPDHDLDAEAQWWDSFEVPPERLVAVRDLDLVDPDRWSAALDVLLDDPATAEVLAEPDGYTAWWLRRFAELDGVALRGWRHPDDPTWRGLLPPITHEALRRAPMERAAPLLAGAFPADTDEADDWLTALADPAREVPPGVAARAHAALTQAYRSGRIVVDRLDPPPRLRTLAGVAAEDAVIVDQPWWLQVIDPAEAVIVGDGADRAAASAFAELVDAPLASEALASRVVSSGRSVDPEDAPVTALLAATGWTASGPVMLHDDLVVAVFVGDDEERHHVLRWYDDGVLQLSARAAGGTAAGG